MTKKEYREKAVEQHANHECEIYRTAEVSITDTGAWVQAWVWVDNDPESDQKTGGKG